MSLDAEKISILIKDIKLFSMLELSETESGLVHESADKIEKAVRLGASDYIIKRHLMYIRSVLKEHLNSAHWPEIPRGVYNPEEASWENVFYTTHFKEQKEIAVNNLIEYIEHTMQETGLDDVLKIEAESYLKKVEEENSIFRETILNVTREVQRANKSSPGYMFYNTGGETAHSLVRILEDEADELIKKNKDLEEVKKTRFNWRS